MRIRISYKTSYHYDAPVPFALQQLRKTPLSSPMQTVAHWQMTLDGATEELSFTDQHGNHVILSSIEPARTEMSIHCEGEIDTHPTQGILGMEQQRAPLWYYRRETPATTMGPELRKLMAGLGEDPDIVRMHKLSELVRSRVAYETGRTEVTTTAEEALKAGHGVCQDHTHIFIAAARSIGFPARYVSGYLLMDDRIDQEAAHAWAEVFVPDIGWVGFDISNVISPDERYVRVACGLDYKEASPVSGMRLGGSAESLTVSLQVEQQ
ncbi:transglutaminase family protein [Nisaea sp.]|uniref:transglutaminase family protein n=1 Tax=Nisaea sp. TaxID=2024842 RepID=UPI0032EEB5A1